MPNNGTLNTSGVSTSISNISNVAVSNGLNTTQTSNNVKFRYRVTGLLPNGNVYFEDTFLNYGKSNLGNPNTSPENEATPLNKLSFQQPFIGEYIDLVFAGSPKETSNNPNKPKLKPYYTCVLNIWNNINTNKTLDPSVPGQSNESKLANINTKSYINSSNGFI